MESELLMQMCEACFGSGARPGWIGDNTHRCYDCDGVGHVLTAGGRIMMTLLRKQFVDAMVDDVVPVLVDTLVDALFDRKQTIEDNR